MDYQGNYFPEEHDENESKTYRRIKGVFKWTMYGISFLLYAVIIIILFVNRDSDILETNYMSYVVDLKETDYDDVKLYRINAKDFMNDLGSLQLYNIDYSQDYSLLEIGVKFNINKILNSDENATLIYMLKDSDGNTYDLVNTVTDSRGRYGFARLCFKNINIDLDSNDLRYNTAQSGALAPAVPSTDTFYERSDVSYKFVILSPKGEIIHEFTIYDNSVTFNSTEYEN